MNLYELNAEIENFEFEFDEETGEITNLSDLDNLNLMRDEKIENLALYIKNINAEKQAIKDEIERLQKRLKAKDTKEKGLKSYLDQILDGNKFETSKVDIRYRKSKTVKIKDDKSFVEFAKENGLSELVTIKHDEKPNKANIKKYLKDYDLPYCSIVEKKNMSIK